MSNFQIIQIVIIVASTIFLIFVSWRSLHDFHSHGFPRFFAFESVVIMVALNLPYWFENPLSISQLISWCFLLFSIVSVLFGFIALKKKGGNLYRTDQSANYQFENTVKLVQTGIYKYIRHPMYASLFWGAWGVFFKNISILNFIIVVISTFFVIVAAKWEEKENIFFFGSEYEKYLTKTKLLIPFLF